MTIPAPIDSAEVNRVTHTRLRRSVLYDDWLDALKERVAAQIGTVREEAWGIVDMSANLFALACTGRAVLYDRPPTLGHDLAEGAQVIDAVARTGLWSLQQRTQRDTIAFGEMLVRGDAPEGRLTYRTAFPDMVEAEGHPDRPDQPVYISELRERVIPGTQKAIWVRDVLDIRDLQNPIYRVVSAKGGAEEDLSFAFLELPSGTPAVGGLTGDAYPYRDLKGTPVLPYVLYHAQKTGRLWDWSTGRGLVEGTLNVGVLRSMQGHLMRSASWPQRWMLDCYVEGAGISDEDGDGEGRSSYVTDQSTVVALRSVDRPDARPQIGQWQPGGDPKVLGEAIAAYELRVASTAGPGVNFQRLSGDPSSGYALGIDRMAQREAQRACEPTFRDADERLMRLSAILLNRANGTALPESGYRIAYAGIPMSPEELTAQREHLTGLIGAGLIDRVTAYQQLHPGKTRAEAEQDLLEIATINARFRAA